MSAAADKSDKQSVPSEKSNKSTVILLFTIAADTTWRMFVPVIGGTVLGVWLDNAIETKPILTILCITLGVVIAGILVRQQLNRKLTNDK